MFRCIYQMVFICTGFFKQGRLLDKISHGPMEAEATKWELSGYFSAVGCRVLSALLSHWGEKKCHHNVPSKWMRMDTTNNSSSSPSLCQEKAALMPEHCSLWELNLSFSAAERLSHFKGEIMCRWVSGGETVASWMCCTEGREKRSLKLCVES